ncbi:MAG: cytochrome c3 family protein [Thermodesulfobacterium sp.]|nr:cytochrome c3 family protein [Thermodesulfobacterium sp.]
MFKYIFRIFLLFFLFTATSFAEDSISVETRACLSCHRIVTPGIVKDWEASVHSKTTLKEALNKNSLSKKVSTNSTLAKDDIVIGCAECHTANSELHKDTFEHNGFKVHIVVSPKDCAICHSKEVEEYNKNLMAEAYGNLKDNPLYAKLIKSSLEPSPNTLSENDACLACHGTKVEVKDKVVKNTMLGEMEFPLLSGWPNNGVGRINPDGSKGACTSCHPRHSFSIEIARKPYTCSQCHKGPDVPAYKVYVVSKHGNIFYSEEKNINFKNTPLKAGEDFRVPTCATCHVSLIVDSNNNVIIERSHQMNDRLAWRIFGLIYAHPHPKDSYTAKIKNKKGLSLPTELTGEFVKEFLISKRGMKKRENKMKKICISCHSTSWTENFFSKFHNTIKTTNEQTLEATKILLKAWEKSVAEPSNPFDETIEKMWVEQWLFYANSVRFASAMGGADYGVFEKGRWYLNKNIQNMKEWLMFLLKTKEVKN